MSKRTLSELDQEIAEIKAALQDVHGTETEVYARIVGYYRAVKHWNKGKRDEYDLRKMFIFDDNNCDVSETVVENVTQTKADSNEKLILSSDTKTVAFELYTRKTCPNCPPVKAFMDKVDLPGRKIDVDTKEGLAEAAKKGIFASPTVIFYNEAGVETARCHNVEELEAVFDKVAVSA